MKRFVITNTVEDKIIFDEISESANGFVSFVEKIAKENGDENLDLGSISESANYIERFCENLKLEIEQQMELGNGLFLFKSELDELNRFYAKK